MPKKNPFEAYKKNRKESLSGRDIEVAVLEKAAMNFRICKKNWDSKTGFNKELDDAVKFNQRVWDIFQSDWKSEECLIPVEVRQNLLSLSVFVRKASLDLIAYPKPEKVDVLININENIAKGLNDGYQNTIQKSEDKSPDGDSPSKGQNFSA
jgi:flagellar biosynthesis activator protein FlaF